MRAISLQPWSSPDHRTRAPALALAALALGLLAAPTVTMGETIFACVKNDTGALRIVAKGTACRSGEYRLTWGTEGPQGPPGPAFPITCPADSVVVGHHLCGHLRSQRMGDSAERHQAHQEGQ